MTKWEYEWVRPGDLSPEDMAKMGWRGWEFVGPLGGGWIIFKRPARPEKADLLIDSCLCGVDIESLAAQINAVSADWEDGPGDSEEPAEHEAVADLRILIELVVQARTYEGSLHGIKSRREALTNWMKRLTERYGFFDYWKETSEQ